MCNYAAFGGVLRSELAFPELAIADSAPVDWTLRVAANPPDESINPIGERRVREETYRTYGTADGFRLDYSHAGVFDVVRNGSEITWHPSPDASAELARAIVLGPVLALALEISGHLCLHGSAIEIADRGIALLGPKHHGKSTLAVALTNAGARFLGDDTIAVRVGPPAVLRPGIGSVRLWEDAARELRVRDLCDTVLDGVKATASGFAEPALRRSEVALGAVYVLEPVAPEEATAPVRRSSIAPVAAAVALSHHAKLPDPLVGYQAAGARLRAAVAVAATVPVYALHVARDFVLLPAAVEQIFDWHCGESHSPGPVGS
ncbi:MAG: hypothetical protein ACRENI_14160 [Gemmatimonadaceae bacterium]